MGSIKCLEPIIDKDTKILILGTIPGTDSLTNKRYYDNRDNIFWDIIFRIFDKNWSMDDLVHECNINYNIKIKLLLENKIGLWDVIKSCNRKGNSDREIKNPVYNDFNKLFIKHPQIKKIIFSSKEAYKHYKKEIKHPQHISFEILYSTSSLCPINTFYVFRQWKNALIEREYYYPL